ncbi:MAG: glycosyltransferase [Nitrospinaceae bacterium]|nr:glycosyltransferase family 2 protein [Nitrospinaceae bacterium]NIR55080.1 glycosyltransferase family 2 protein [Nitrospinaceae bacterium]NIS85489.1 glycosyltransferase family 2 protein [Nitrospinaceae bacterium]NIT82327.1 glycosyltransferase family 2 protein [Nitrospinaceae bacterium]NIU44545.1 glycosyltransferase family 2 protein [Nitrospinaceae bacterium]
MIVNTENVGFARATNQGIRISRGRRILLLNNDTVVLPGALETMMDLMDRNPALGLLGCRLLNPDYSVQQSFGRMVSFVNDFGRKFILNKLYRKYHNPLVRAYLDWLHSSPKEVDWVRGACMLARREALVDVGLMDENFFMYLEDIDLGVGMRQLGWEVCFTPAAAVIHYEGASSAKNLFRTALEYRKSQLYFYKKHYGRSGLFRLRVYLYGKLFKLRLQSQIQRWMSRTSPAAIEETEKLNREIFRIVRDYR